MFKFSKHVALMKTGINLDGLHASLSINFIAPSHPKQLFNGIHHAISRYSPFHEDLQRFVLLISVILNFK